MSTEGESTGRRVPLADLAAVFVLALGLRLLHVGHDVAGDEIHHLLAASRFLVDGTFSLYDGEPYDRAALFTYVIVGLFRLFGENPVLARLPSVLAGAILPVALFYWLHKEASRTAAWIAAVLACLDPLLVERSRIVRFYSAQSLLFFVGAIAVYWMLSAGGTMRRKVLLGVGAGSAFALAVHLQVLTMIGVLALAVWVLVDQWSVVTGTIGDLVKRFPRRAVGLGAALVVAAVAFMLWSRLPADMWALYNYTNPWSEWSRYHVLFYHAVLMGSHPLAWVLLPIATICGLSEHRRPVLMAAAVFGITLVLLSFAAWKGDRFIAFVMPFFFALTGVGCAQLFRAVQGTLHSVGHQLGRLGSAFRAAGWTTVVGFLAAGSPGIIDATQDLVSGVVPGAPESWKPYPDVDPWRAAAVGIVPSVSADDAIVVSATMPGLYHIGRIDYVLNVGNRIQDTVENEEFAVSSKVGVPVISEPESVATLIDCLDSGVIFIDPRHWNAPMYVPVRTATFIESATTLISPVGDPGVLAFRWDRDTPRPEGSAGATTALGEGRSCPQE